MGVTAAALQAIGVVFKRGIAADHVVDGGDRFGGKGAAAQVGVDDHPGRVDHAAQRGAFERERLLGGPGRDCVDRLVGLFTRQDALTHGVDRFAHALGELFAREAGSEVDELGALKHLFDLGQLFQKIDVGLYVVVRHRLPHLA